MATNKIIWTVRELTEILRKRQKNKFDVNMGISGKRGNGKTLIKGSKVLMANGDWKNCEDIKIGDKVISPQVDESFSVSTVISTHSRFEPDIYEVREETRNKRLLYSCSYNHLIPTIKQHSKRTSKDDSTRRIYDRRLFNVSAKTLYKREFKGSHFCSFTTSLIDFGNKDCSIDPYSLGVWLGDGGFTKRSSLGITSEDKIIIENIPYELMNICNKKNTNCKSYRYSNSGEFALELIKLGLKNRTSGDKFIPKEALLSSIDYRFKLLAGLIDTDGYISKANQITYCSKSELLANDLKDLVFSLGGYSIIRKIKKRCQNNFIGEYFDVSIQFKNPKIIPLKLKKKYDRLKIRKINPRNIAINLVKGKPNYVYGFELDKKESLSQWFITDNWMITHNSTFAFKILNSFKKEGFNQRKHQVYARKDVINLLAVQQFGYCWDDEAINSGYKRDFQKTGQKDLIKIITNYRDNHNIYASALPFFYSLDKDLRDLIFIHFHIVERGVAIVFLPLADQIHTQDQWDTKNNIKIEEQENKRMQKNPLLPFRYQRFSTFAGYVYFGPMSKKQEDIYKKIKREKRAKSFKDSGVITEEETFPFLERVYDLLIQGKLSKDGLIQACIIDGEKYSNILIRLNEALKNKGEIKTASQLFRTETILPQRAKSQINQLVPGFVNQTS